MVPDSHRQGDGEVLVRCGKCRRCVLLKLLRRQACSAGGLSAQLGAVHYYMGLCMLCADARCAWQSACLQAAAAGVAADVQRTSWATRPSVVRRAARGWQLPGGKQALLPAAERRAGKAHRAAAAGCQQARAPSTNRSGQ